MFRAGEMLGNEVALEDLRSCVQATIKINKYDCRTKFEIGILQKYKMGSVAVEQPSIFACQKDSYLREVSISKSQ